MYMLTEEEKTHIVDRIRFEESVRKELAAGKPDGDPSIWKKLNSNLVLLLIGSLITGLLVPLFQYNQRKLEWERQIKYENVRFTLDMMRDCTKEFVSGAAYISEAYELVKPFIDSATIDKVEYQKFRLQFREMQNSRIKQNAKIISFVIYLPQASTTQQLIDDYVVKSSDHIGDMERYVYLKYCASNSGNCTHVNKSVESLDKLKETFENFEDSNEAFDRVIAKINEQIKTVQNDNEF